MLTSRAIKNTAALIFILESFPLDYVTQMTGMVHTVWTVSYHRYFSHYSNSSLDDERIQ